VTNDNHPPISFHFPRFPKGSVPEGHRNDATCSRAPTSADDQRSTSLKKIEKGSVSQSGPLAPRVDKAIRRCVSAHNWKGVSAARPKVAPRTLQTSPKHFPNTEKGSARHSEGSTITASAATTSAKTLPSKNQKREARPAGQSTIRPWRACPWRKGPILRQAATSPLTRNPFPGASQQARASLPCRLSSDY